MTLYLLHVQSKILSQIVEEPEIIEEIVYPDGEENENLLCLGKSFNTIHFLLTGEFDLEKGNIPEKYIVSGDEEVLTEMDFGDGFAKYITSSQVLEVNNFLQLLDIEEFKNKFIVRYFTFLEKFNEIKQISQEDKTQEVENLLFYFEKLKNYYQKAALKKNAMLYFFD